MKSTLSSLAGFIIGLVIAYTGINYHNINAMQQDIRQLQAEKISGWGNE